MTQIEIYHARAIERNLIKLYRVKPVDRPVFSSRLSHHEHWAFEPEVHSSIGCGYALRYYGPEFLWIVDFDDAASALLFKLTWG